MSEAEGLALARIATALERLADVADLVAGNSEDPGCGVYVLLDPDNVKDVKEVLGGVNR